MTDVIKHTADSAQEEARHVLESVQKGLGFMSNLIAYMADAPALAQGYNTLSGIFEKTSFSATERQIVLLTVSRES